MEQVNLERQYTLISGTISNIDTFYGDRTEVVEFVQTIEMLQPGINQLSEIEKQVIFNQIKQKIKGNAKIALKADNPRTWAEIRSSLLSNFGEHTPINVLEDKLYLVRFRSNVKNLYDEIIKRQSRLINAHILQNTLTDETTNRINTIALNTFRSNLPEPVKGIIINRNPPNIRTAYQIIQNSNYTYFAGLFPANNSQQNFSHKNNNSEQNDNSQNNNKDYENKQFQQNQNANRNQSHQNFRNYQQNRNTNYQQSGNQNYQRNYDRNSPNRQNFNNKNPNYKRNNTYPQNNDPNDRSMQTIRSRNINLPEPMDISTNEYPQNPNESEVLNENFQRIQGEEHHT